MTTVIPFGYDCNTADIIKDGGMRKQSMPFDWMFASSKLIKDSLDNNFNNWFDPDKIKHMIRKEDGHSYTTHVDYPVSDTNGLKRGVFHHYNMTDPETINTLKRRIDRFYRVIDSNEPVVFVTSSTKQDFMNDGLLDYFNRSADTSFVFLEWVPSQENKTIIEYEASHMKIQYFYKKIHDRDNVAPAICNAIRSWIE